MSSLAHHAADPFRLLVESVVEYAIFMLDPAGQVASWNPAAERIFGYRSEEIIGKHFSCLYPAGEIDAGEPAANLKIALEQGNHVQECLRVRNDGSTFWAVATISDLKDFFGNHAGFAEVTRDISDRRLAQDALRRERDLAEAMLQSLPGVYYMYDESGHFLRWNRRFEEVTEYSASEMQHLHPLDLFEGDEKGLLADRIASVFRDGYGEVEATFVSRSGRRTPYYFNGVRAEIDGQRCLLGMGIDISARIRSEKALRATDQRLRLAATAANVGLWDWDLRTNEVYFSPEWKSQIGYRDDEIGNSFDEWKDRVHPDDLEMAMQRMRAFIADPALRYAAEFRLRHRDGSYRWILSQGSLLFDEQGQPTHMLGSHVDVTEQRQVERQRHHAQKMEAIGQLAAGVAHDFNNLLTIINGYTQLLLGRLERDDPMHDLLLEIHRAGDRAGTLTRQLLMFSRQQVVEPKPLNLNRIVDDTGMMLQRLIGADIILTTSLSAGLGTVKADQGQIEQILINFAVNARDAMPDGGRITIETRNVVLDERYCRAFPDLPAGDYVLLAVSDTGCGITDPIKSRIFEPFFTTKSPGKGTGLGLATVHGIVKQSRGHVAVYSEIGKGATFKVYLPVIPDGQADSNPGARTNAMPQGTETILLAEDDSAVRAMARHILLSCGYTVLEASDGAEALSLASSYEEPLHLLISDVVMPNKGGRELVEQIATLRPDCKVLFLSGYADDAVVRHGVLTAEFPFLQKPFTPSLLAQTVRSVLETPRRTPNSEQ